MLNSVSSEYYQQVTDNVINLAKSKNHSKNNFERKNEDLSFAEEKT
jgi:hypothetical protein